MVADVEPGAGAGAVRADGDDRRRVAEVAGRVERRHDDRARAVDLDRAVVGAERLDDEYGAARYASRSSGRRRHGALVRLGVRPLGDRDGAEVARPWPVSCRKRWAHIATYMR